MIRLPLLQKILFTLTLLAGFALVSCSDDDPVSCKQPQLEVTPALTFDCSQDQTKSLEIELNCPLFDWTIDADPWIELSQKSGKGTATILVTVKAHATPRNGTITVTARNAQGATDVARCKVEQTEGGVPSEIVTNVAVIRKLVRQVITTTDNTALPDSIQAMELKGIVISDKNGGNQQPFILVVTDNTAEGGAGLALSIKAEENTFVRGNVITASLKSAEAALFNGLLQITLSEPPVLSDQTEPLQPIIITADKIGEYESQYVTIEQTQPDANETGTWNSESNKGNVSMETRDGKGYKIRTLATADYASERIPDKSGSVSGIAGIYNTTLQIAPCNSKDIRLTEERFTTEYTQATLSEVLATAADSYFQVKETTVVGANEQGVILQQGSARMYAFSGKEHGLQAGDIVTVTGKTEMRNGLLQFGTGSTLVKTGQGDVNYPAPEAFAAAQIEAYMDAPDIRYVTYTGDLVVAGNYVNVEIEGTSVQGSLDYMSDTFIKAYDNHSITITGWLFGSYKDFMYTVPVTVKDNGEVVEVIPDGAIYYNTFDRSVAFMTDGKWPFLADFDGWINQKGSGANDVTYDYEHMSVRTNQSSKGSLSQYDGSGKNNIFFSTAPNRFMIQRIAVSDQNLKLTFGAQRYAQGATNTFVKSDFQVRLSADGLTWSQALDYGFGSVQDVPGEWRLASADFTLPAGTNYLYIKFEAKMSSTNRIDDVLLTPGPGGQQIVFGAEEHVPTSTIATVLASPVDELYKIEGQVIGTHSKGFLTKDATGTILVFKKNHGTVIGDYVTVEGATTEYGGMKQFGETSDITVTGHGSYTQPQPKMFAAAEFNAYITDPTIQYVEYTGNLTEYRDNNHQYHYNIAVDGTAVVGSVAYPNNELNIKSYLKRDVKVRGYTVGVSGTDVKYLNTMVLSIEFAEEETMPDESTAITVKELNDRLKNMASGAPLANLVAVKGYIAANNQGGNLYQLLSLTDNTGQAGSGIILKGADYTENNLPVGTKVIVSLKFAEYDLYMGLPQIKGATVFTTKDKAQLNVPIITDAQAADYLGQYVRIKNLAPAASATTWVVGNNTTTTDFTGENGKTIAARVTKYAVFANETIAHKTAELGGVVQVYNGTYQIYPNSKEDVAGFSVD